MEPQQFSLYKLPQRQPGVVVKLPASQRRNFLSNYYEIKMGSKNSSIFQFHFQTTPQIQQDSRQLLYQVIRSLRKTLKEKIGFVTAAGNMVWGEQNLKIPLTLKTEFKHEQVTHKFEVLIKPTKSLNIADLIKTPEGLKMVFQVFNNKLKERLRNNNMDQITRGKYFNKKEVQVHQVGLNVLRGFKFTLCKLNKGLTLQIDVCSKVFRSANFLEQINNLGSQDQAKAYQGATVITRYGRYRTFRIIRIDYTQTAKSQFFHQKRAGKISYAKYYQQNYGIKIKSLNQPLIEVCLRTDKRFVNNTIQKTEIKGFLLPELVALTGMSDKQRANYNTMKEIAPYTRLTPKQRIDQIYPILDNLMGNDIRIEAPLRLEGFQLFQPEIRLKSQNYKPQDGTFRFKDSLKVSIDPKDWVMVYSQGKNSKYDDNDADDFVDLLKQASKVFGIKVNDPGFITCGQNINSWKQQINEDIKKNGKPQIIVLLLNPQEQRFYGEMKKFITCDLQIPSQFVRKRTVSRKQKGNPIAPASMILIQMNQKMGGTAWEVQKKSEYLQKKKMMYGAFSISKGKRGFTLAFVGTLNIQCSKVISYCKAGYKNKDDIPKADFQTIFENWAKNFVKQNKSGPQLIIVYREGLSIPQIQRQIPNELDALEKIILKIGQKTKNQNYRPEVVYLTVNKKINTRFFEEASGGHSGGKFAPKVTNPPSGSCIFEQLSINTYDFHIASQKVTQGTCTPTQYIVVHNKSNISQEALAQFTFEQTFNYYNWQGAVKVPACMQCADKLATLVGQSIQANVIEGEITKGFFFL